jgi:hypothetical protein
VQFLFTAARAGVLFAGVLSLCHCHASDVGQPCPQAIQGLTPATATGDPTVSNTVETLVQGVTLPCEEMLCVASVGSRGYCTKKCLNDTACPRGFICRAVQEAGAFAAQKFCVWKPCQTRADCGGKDFCCNLVSTGSPIPTTRLCSFAKDTLCD